MDDHVYFICPDTDHAQLSLIDQSGLSGEAIWTVSTHHRIRNRGIDMTLCSTPPERGILIYHEWYGHTFFKVKDECPGQIRVAIRADSRVQRTRSHYRIYQNAAQVSARGDFFIPFWPQPGLLPRDESRGSEVSMVGFKGHGHNLCETIRCSQFRNELRSRGLEFTSVEKNDHTVRPQDGWRDYRSIDVIVAMRRPDPCLWVQKPESKLINAWAAGVPAILGPEIAFRTRRKNPLDYIEVQSAEEALQAIDRLRSNPGLYLDMVENGKNRQNDVSDEQIIEDWLQMISYIQSQVRGQAGDRKHLRPWIPPVITPGNGSGLA